MKRYCTIVSVALLIALFIYLFYRTEKTVVNVICSKLLGGNTTAAFRDFIKAALPLPDIVVYSLPGALWVFAATLISRHLYITIRSRVISLCIFPMLYAILLEFLQLTHLLPGTFDYIDIWLAASSGILAKTAMKCPLSVQHLFCKYNHRTTSLVYVYGIVLLSHVYR